VSLRLRLLAAVFLLGCYATLAQVVFTREMLVVFFGNELCLGTILAAWLLCIGAGSLAGRAALRRIRAPRLPAVLAAALAWLALALPPQIAAMRAVRLLWHVPPGEYATFGTVVASVCLLFLPSCLGVGLFFPLACRALPAAPARPPAAASSPTAAVYTVESAGSMAGGVALTFLLLPRLNSAQVVLVGMAAALLGAALLWRGPARALALLAAAGLAGAGAGRAQWTNRLDGALERLRWRSFGVSAAAAPGATPTRLVATRDTVYQNLAVTESAGQFALYGNGQVMYVFPDPGGYEHRVHFIMAQNPSARRVLLLGGNPVGDIPELLKYPLLRLVCVELDPGVARIARLSLPRAYDRVMRDPRVECVAEDGPRYVRRCRERFDAVLINAPEPTTAAANRYYTEQFYRAVGRILAPSGFVFTAVTASERLEFESLDMAASVYRTLRTVFPVVLVTAEARNRFFAGFRAAAAGAEDAGGLTFARATLAARSRAARVPAEYFRPDYFLGADELAPDKTARLEARLRSAGAEANTDERPISYYYNLLMWTRHSGSGLGVVFKRAASLNPTASALLLLAGGALCVPFGLAARRRRGGFPRFLLAALTATAGLYGMAVEIVLILLYQNLYGYVYTRLGLIVATFMLGLALGAPAGARAARAGSRRTWRTLAGIEAVLAGGVLLLPRIVMASAEAEGALLSAEHVIMLLVLLTGGAVAPSLRSSTGCMRRPAGPWERPPPSPTRRIWRGRRWAVCWRACCSCRRWACRAPACCSPRPRAWGCSCCSRRPRA